MVRDFFQVIRSGQYRVSFQTLFQKTRLGASCGHLNFLLMILALGVPNAFGSPELRIDGTRFVDRLGRTVLLRGVNFGVDSKLPPFFPLSSVLQNRLVGEAPLQLGSVEANAALHPYLDRLVELGFNTIRLIFNWEAYEPVRGEFNQVYLDAVTALADAAWDRGIFVVLDMHQDGFSHYVGSRCGEGFPAWAVATPQRRTGPVLNRGSCPALWAMRVIASRPMHQAWRSFYQDAEGIRTEFISVWERLALHFRSHPGVIAYDLLNEPWGSEASELGPLYADAAAQIRAIDPTSLIFIEPALPLTVIGMQDTHLTRPQFEGFAYAPHYYNPWAFGFGFWTRFFGGADTRAFRQMARRAHQWGVPLFVGEFGPIATTRNAGASVDHQFDLLDSFLASATQWSYSPGWTFLNKDGWNFEDFSIVDSEGGLRPNYRPRPTVQKAAGKLTYQWMTRDRAGDFVAFEARWLRDGSVPLGSSASLSSENASAASPAEIEVSADAALAHRTEIFFDEAVFLKGRPFQIETIGEGVNCTLNAPTRRLICDSTGEGAFGVILRVSD
jgi:endoglycosylceramidase